MKFQLAAIFLFSLVVGMVGCQSQKAEAEAVEQEQAKVEAVQQEASRDEDDAFIDSLSFNDPQQPAPAVEEAPKEQPEPEIDEEPIGEMITSRDLRKGGVNEELIGVALSSEEYKNKRFRTVDLQTRQIVDDWERFWLMDRPSRGSIYPIP